MNPSSVPHLTTIADIIHHMTGDERMEAMIEAHAALIRGNWDTLRKGGRLETETIHHGLDVHVEPRMDVWLRNTEIAAAESQDTLSKDTQQKSPHSESRPDELTAPAEQSRFRELNQGLNDWRQRYFDREPDWILITERAGGGKTCLSWQICNELSSGDRPYFVLRFETFWPESLPDFHTRITQALQHARPGHDLEAKTAQDWILDQHRCVVVFDALDQVSLQQARLLDQLRRELPGIRVIVTSRPNRVQSTPNQFDPDVWRRFRLLPFHEQQIADYRQQFAECMERVSAGHGARSIGFWQQAVASLEKTDDVLSLPYNLKHLRKIVEDSVLRGTRMREFRTAGDLRWEIHRRALRELTGKGTMTTVTADDLEDLQILAGCLAFQIMCHSGEYIATGRTVQKIRTATRTRLSLTDEQWKNRTEKLMDVALSRSTVVRCDDGELSFSTQKTCEFYAGLYLAIYADEADIEQLRPHVGSSFVDDTETDPWEDAWHYAIDMLRTTDSSGNSVHDPNAYTRSMTALFATPHAGHARPSELMSLAWHTMQNAEFDGLAEVLSAYRQQFLDILCGDDLARAQLAAQLWWEDDVRALVDKGESGLWSFTDLRPDADRKPAYAFCSDEARNGNTEQLSFWMGASDQDDAANQNEQPWQEVNDLPSFYMATCCVTRAQYRLFDPEREKLHSAERQKRDLNINDVSPEPDCPMTYVDWYDAMSFTLWLGEKYRLPNEVEWEGAAWGGIDRNQHPEYVIGVSCEPGKPGSRREFTTESVNFDGDHPLGGPKSTFIRQTLPVRWDSDRLGGVFQENSRARKLPVYQANGFDLWQMNGNVWEWCRSAWCDALSNAIDHRSETILQRKLFNPRSIRGGSWNFDAYSCRCSYRLFFDANARHKSFGFRPSRTR